MNTTLKNEEFALLQDIVYIKGGGVLGAVIGLRAVFDNLGLHKFVLFCIKTPGVTGSLLCEAVEMRYGNYRPEAFVAYAHEVLKEDKS